MKNNRFITLVISCFILLIGIVYFLWQDESSRYLSLDGLYLGQSKKMGVEEKPIDISGVALGVTDNIDNVAIKKA